MAPVSNNYEHAFQQYLDTTPWDQYEDHYDTAEYVPELLEQLNSGQLGDDEEKQLLGELLARMYQQESLSNAIQVVIYPLLLLCIMDKIRAKAFVLEFILEIEQRYLYLKGVIGVLPYRYAYVGEVFVGDEVAARAVEEGEKPYYEAVVALREWITALFSDKDTLVQNLAIKIYGLTAFPTGDSSWEAGPLLPQLNKEHTVANTIIVLGLVARLSGAPLRMPDDIAGVASYQPYIAVSKGLAGEADDVSLLMQEGGGASPDYTVLPWFNGDLSLLSLAALANNTSASSGVVDYYMEQLRALKTQPQTIYGFEWKTYEVAAEFIAAAYFVALVPAGHKRTVSELSETQISLLKKLSAELKIITSMQTVAGLPESIKEVNQFLGLAKV